MKKVDNKKIIKRLKIIEGQVRGIQDMINNERYCIDIITQISATKQALSGIEDVLLENHLSTCLLEKIRSGNQKEEQYALAEILKVYKKAKNK